MLILCSNYGEKRAYLKPHDSMQRLRVSKYNMKPFICIFWNSPGVLLDKRLEKSLTVTSDLSCHKLTNIADNYRSLYNKTAGLYPCKTTLVSTRQIKRKNDFRL